MFSSLLYWSTIQHSTPPPCPYILMFAVNLICPCDPFILSLKLPNIGVNLFGAIKYILYLKMYCICSWYIYLRNHLQDPFHFIKKRIVLVCSVCMYTENCLLWRCFYILENSLSFSTFYSASTIGDKGGKFYSGLEMVPFLPAQTKLY